MDKIDTIKELLSGKWVDCDKVQEILGLNFSECFSLFDFSRTAEWWNIVGETEEERVREGQKIITKFRLKSIPEHTYYNCHNLICRRKYEKDGYVMAIDEFTNELKSVLPITVHKNCSEIDYEVDYALYNMRFKIDGIAEQLKEGQLNKQSDNF